MAVYLKDSNRFSAQLSINILFGIDVEISEADFYFFPRTNPVFL